MNEAFNFLADNAWARWSLGVIFLLVIARKPTLRYFQWRMEKKATELEMSTYDILRKEISALSDLLIKEQERNRELTLKITELQASVEGLQQQLENRIE